MAKKYKTNITINGPDENTFKVSLNTDEDILKLMKASRISGVDLHFQGKQIENPQFNNNKIKGSTEIIIGNPPTYFNIKVENHNYPHIPFNRKKLPKNRLLFTTTSSELGVKIRLEMKFIEPIEVKINLTISPISNNINDLLKLEKIKKEWYDKHFEMKIEGIDEIIAKGKFDFLEYTDWLIEFYEKVNYINKKLNLQLTHPETYEITNDDLDSVGYICNFLKYKKIPFNTFTINLKLSYSKLNDIITGNAKDIHVKSTFKTKLLNKKINLGKFKMDISEVIFLNFKEILETYNKNKKEQKDVDIQLIIRSMKPEENYLIFI